MTRKLEISETLPEGLQPKTYLLPDFSERSPKDDPSLRKAVYLIEDDTKVTEIRYTDEQLAEQLAYATDRETALFRLALLEYPALGFLNFLSTDEVVAQMFGQRRMPNSVDNTH